MKKVFKNISVLLLVLALLLCSVSCSFANSSFKVKSFDERCVTDENGFRYYHDTQNGDRIYIVGIPDTEELVIPEYIENVQVTELGHKRVGLATGDSYYINGTNTKTLTLQHDFNIRDENEDSSYVEFPNLEKLIYNDFVYCNLLCKDNELTVQYFLGKSNSNVPVVELRKTDRELDISGFVPKVILIPEFVSVIEKGVFDGLNGVTIKTSFESKPEGREDGWNGECEVEWGS